MKYLSIILMAIVLFSCKKKDCDCPEVKKDPEKYYSKVVINEGSINGKFSWKFYINDSLVAKEDSLAHWDEYSYQGVAYSGDEYRVETDYQFSVLGFLGGTFGYSGYFVFDYDTITFVKDYPFITVDSIINSKDTFNYLIL